VWQPAPVRLLGVPDARGSATPDRRTDTDDTESRRSRGHGTWLRGASMPPPVDSPPATQADIALVREEIAPLRANVTILAETVVGLVKTVASLVTPSQLDAALAGLETRLTDCINASVVATRDFFQHRFDKMDASTAELREANRLEREKLVTLRSDHVELRRELERHRDDRSVHRAPRKPTRRAAPRSRRRR
jgi:hypothetical protein